jgi:hypothetical protein
MKIKSIALAAILATTAGFASAANVYNLGDITNSGALFVSSTFAANAAINDTWTFSLTGSNDLSSLISRNFSTANGAILNFAGSISGGSLAAAESLQLDSNASSQNLSFASTLGAGSYSLLISGLSQRAGTRYTFNADVTPVPEPETYALLLAGLGVLAFVAKRRKSV